MSSSAADEDESLPAPRELLAALVRTTAAPPAAGSDGRNSVEAAVVDRSDRLLTAATTTTTTATTTNPLRHIPPAHRPLLATLHVLFPALLLPALDLLDRRRVVRWVVAGDNNNEQQQQQEQQRPTTSAGAAVLPPVYQVNSGAAAAAGSAPHVVHLRAWHCTCAYFALRAATAGYDEQEEGRDEGSRADSIDAVSTPSSSSSAAAAIPRAFSTPPCKHLLACLLAEQWPDGLGRYVVDGAAAASATTGETCTTPATLAGVVAGVM